jgi:protein TonB
MFDDFSSSAVNKQQARKRFGSSMAAAIVLYGTSSAAIVGATATARQVIEEKETQIDFAPPPEPEPPPPPVEAAPPPKPASPRPKVKRATLKPPDEIPLEKPKESDGPLTEAGESGPQDGFLDGVEGGTGTAAAPKPPPPPPKPEKLVQPVGIAGIDDTPKYPSSARRKGIEGVVVVKFEVLENGRVGNARIISGPPEFHDTVLKFVATWRFKPAHRGGKPVRYSMQKPIRFRLEDA